MNNAQFAARVLAIVKEGSMLRITECTACHEQRPHKARGLCNRCYKRMGDALRPRNLPTHGLLPIPPMVRCAGAPGLACPRMARADVGRCWRCQQEAARAGVAA